MQVKSISPKELNTIISNGVPDDCITLDVRTPVEFAELHIDGAVNIELSKLAGNEDIFHGKHKVFVVCKGGVRAGKACQKVPDSLAEKMYILDGGMDSWNAGGFAVRKVKNIRFSIMQQMQVIVGFCSALGAFLALVLCKWFAVIPLFFGCGFVFAGLTGTCLLMKLLGKMPWNKV